MHTFYHVNYSKPYNPFPDFVENTQIVIGEQNNPFFDYFYTNNDSDSLELGDSGQKLHYSTILNFLGSGQSSEFLPPPNIMYPYINTKFLDLYKLNREMVLENIRLLHYPHMPSRMKCLWVSTTPEENMVWKDHFSTSGNLKVITFESESLPVKVDSKFVPVPQDSLSEKERKAHAYWSGEMSDTPMIEHLFVGTATIKRIEAA